MQSFFMKKFPPYFVGGRGDTILCLHTFPISKSSSLTFVIKTMTFQAKLPSHRLQYSKILKFPNCCKPELQNHIAKNIKLGNKFVTNL